MRSCDKCGQALPDVTNPFDISALRELIADSDITWEWLAEGSQINIQGLPVGAIATVVASKADTEYDSYGDAVGSGFVVFSISYNSESRNYKIEGSQDSYAGWEWQESYITQVAAQPKTVVLWEAV